MLPVLARFGPLTIGTHDFFTILGLLAGFALYYRALRRDRILGAPIAFISVAAVLGGALGARLITSWEILGDVQTAGMPLTYLLTHGPKSIIGGLAGGYLAIVLSKRALGYTLSTGDYYAAAVPLALAIGRVGCFLSELPLGTSTSLPWGMTVSPEAAAAFPRCPGCGGPMHPTMLYEIAFNLVAAALLWRYRSRVPAPGDALKLYLLGAAAFRFLVEFIRTSPRQALDLTAPQWVLIPMIGLLVLHFARQAIRGAWRVPNPPIAYEPSR